MEISSIGRPRNVGWVRAAALLYGDWGTSKAYVIGLAVAAVGFDRRVPAADRVCLGDTCAMIPPFTGNGMAMAFQSVEVALDPLLAYACGERAWPDVCRTIHAALCRRFRVRLASADTLHPFLLEPPRQRVLTALNRARLLPLRPLYAALH